MMRFIRKLPFYGMMLLLSLIYLLCGYIVGYYQGYEAAFKQKIEILH